MSYKALYRTYRPQAFEDVAGQQHIVKTLKNAFKENKIAHAYLFCGPRGTGKTTMARLFAKGLNCEEGFGCQCNKCQNCIAISEGSHPDVIEIDAASNRGIDDIRDIISKVKYSPIRGKWKVYIIDEVHMMTTEAFNALLKTLEEPPENVVFILCTTEPFKLMPTILSRVQRYDFTKISKQDLLLNLKKVCENEHVEVEEAALEVIVSLSDGGGRDSLSMLDQAIAYASNKLELHHVQELFGLSTLQEKMDLLSSLDKKDVLSFTNKFDDLCSHGIDIKRFTFDLIEIIKDLLIYSTTKDISILKIVTPSYCTSSTISKNKLLYMLDTLMEAYSQFRLVSDIKSIIEVAFLKIASYEEITLENKGEKGEKVIVKEVVKEIIKEVPVASKNVNENKTQASLPKNEIHKSFEYIPPKVEENKKPLPVKKDAPAPTDFEGTPLRVSEDDIINIMVQASKPEKFELLNYWNDIDTYLGDKTFGKYASMLRGTTPRAVSKDAIILSSNFASVVQKISFKENQKGLSNLIELITGKKYYIIALEEKELIDRINKFQNLKQVNKLPSPHPVFFDFSIKEEPKNTKSPTELFVEELNK